MWFVQFKTKVKQLRESDDSVSDFVDFKQSVQKGDVVDSSGKRMQPHQHTYYNSDLMKGIVQRAYSSAIKNKGWSRLSELPDGVTVDTSKFLAIVRVPVDLSMRRK